MAEPRTETVLKHLGTALKEPPLTPNGVSNIMQRLFGGTDAAGSWCWRQAYDAMPAAPV